MRLFCRKNGPRSGEHRILYRSDRNDLLARSASPDAVHSVRRRQRDCRAPAPSTIAWLEWSVRVISGDLTAREVGVAKQLDECLPTYVGPRFAPLQGDVLNFATA
jgi:hypothetical protein